jgi:hypothetical protein
MQRRRRVVNRNPEALLTRKARSRRLTTQRKARTKTRTRIRTKIRKSETRTARRKVTSCSLAIAPTVSFFALSDKKDDKDDKEDGRHPSTGVILML